jgi:RNA polymerase sigma-70 factor, ECF subfamily
LPTVVSTGWSVAPACEVGSAVEHGALVAQDEKRRDVVTDDELLPGGGQSVHHWCRAGHPYMGERLMSGVETTSGRAEEAAVIAAVRGGDQAAFAALAERYRRQLFVHCYRMLGSVQDAEDLVQETLLRAWRARAGFQGRSLFRTWLYRIATNACLNALQRRQRRILPPDLAPATTDPHAAPSWRRELPWLQPYPDRLLEPAAPSQAEPDAVVVSRETIELAYLAAIQHLPPRQRAILLLREVLGWSAKEVAALLETSVASVNSALQRARSTLRTRLPARRLDWTSATQPTREERAVLRRFMEAFERQDAAAMTALLGEDARQTMPPAPLWFDGREVLAAMFGQLFGPGSPGAFRMVATAANRQPAAACYLRRHGQAEYRLIGLNVLRIEGGQIVEITSFAPELVAAFGLPPTL